MGSAFVAELGPKWRQAMRDLRERLRWTPALEEEPERPFDVPSARWGRPKAAGCSLARISEIYVETACRQSLGRVRFIQIAIEDMGECRQALARSNACDIHRVRIARRRRIGSCHRRGVARPVRGNGNLLDSLKCHVLRGARFLKIHRHADVRWVGVGRDRNTRRRYLWLQAYLEGIAVLARESGGWADFARVVDENRDAVGERFKVASVLDPELK